MSVVKISFGFDNVFELDLEQRAVLGVHGGFPELRGGHFAQALVALHGVVLLALFDDVGEELAGGLLLHRLARAMRAVRRAAWLRPGPRGFGAVPRLRQGFGFFGGLLRGWRLWRRTR
jgi:hypothetical protein